MMILSHITRKSWHLSVCRDCDGGTAAAAETAALQPRWQQEASKPIGRVGTRPPGGQCAHDCLLLAIEFWPGFLCFEATLPIDRLQCDWPEARHSISGEVTQLQACASQLVRLTVAMVDSATQDTLDRANPIGKYAISTRTSTCNSAGQ